jgi:hypothetical protein
VIANKPLSVALPFTFSCEADVGLTSIESVAVLACA